MHLQRSLFYVSLVSKGEMVDQLTVAIYWSQEQVFWTALFPRFHRNLTVANTECEINKSLFFFLNATWGVKKENGKKKRIEDLVKKKQPLTAFFPFLLYSVSQVKDFFFVINYFRHWTAFVQDSTLSSYFFKLTLNVLVIS